MKLSTTYHHNGIELPVYSDADMPNDWRLNEDDIDHDNIKVMYLGRNIWPVLEGTETGEAILLKLDEAAANKFFNQREKACSNMYQ